MAVDLNITGQYKVNGVAIGSGLKGLHRITQYFSQLTQGVSAQLNSSSVGSCPMGTNIMYAYPFIPNKDITSGALKINVTTLGAGVNCRILIYSDNNGAPGTKLYESANLDCSTTGIKSAVTSFVFNSGTVYWLCVQSSGATTLTGITPSALVPLFMTSTFTGVPIVSLVNNSIYGSAPANYVINNLSNQAVPTVGIYLS